MKKLKVGIIFGGISTEHNVSIVSGTSVIKKLDKNKYEIYPIYIDKKGLWYEYKKEIEQIEVLSIDSVIDEKEKIENIIEYLKKLDVVFPVMHGLNGEDGSIQGLLEFINVPYVGCNILSSSIGLDKVYTKAIWEKAKIDQVKYEYLKKCGGKYKYIDKQFNEYEYELDEICQKIEENINYPMFVKPSNCGSSVGINKVKKLTELKEAIEYASKFDSKILVEEGKNVRELECAVLGNNCIVASNVGEVISADKFYSFDAKYKNEKSLTVIPADIEKSINEKIKSIAIKAFKAIDGKGMARVDFFIDKDTNKIYINEINTIPGFTNISMYPKLFEESGISYNNLLDKLINLALEK